MIGEKVDKLKEECDSQKLSFYEKTEFGLDTTQKLLKDVENEDDDDDDDDEDDGFGELDHLFEPSLVETSKRDETCRWVSSKTFY